MISSKRITLKDFSKVTGISVSAVSRILNNKPTYCSEQKRQEVLALAKAWNYRPNVGYRIMTGMSTKIVAIIFSQDRVTYSEFLMRLMVQLVSALEAQGYASYTAVMTPSAEQNLEKLLELERKGCRSFILIGHPVGSGQLLEFIKQREFAYIGLNLSYKKDQEATNSNFDKSFYLDESAAIAAYLQIFNERQKNNYRLLMTKSYFQSKVLPLAGSPQQADDFRARLQKVPEFEFSDQGGFDAQYEAGFEAACRALELDPGLEALVCVTDFHALGAAHYLHGQDRKIGDEVLVCGMFNTVATRFSLLPIISARFNLQNLAKLMLKHLFDNQAIVQSVQPEIIIPRRSQT